MVIDSVPITTAATEWQAAVKSDRMDMALKEKARRPVEQATGEHEYNHKQRLFRGSLFLGCGSRGLGVPPPLNASLAGIDDFQ